jgi:hypothetical protein
VSGEEDRWRREEIRRWYAAAPMIPAPSYTAGHVWRHVQVGVERNGADGFVCPCAYVQRSLALGGQGTGPAGGQLARVRVFLALPPSAYTLGRRVPPRLDRPRPITAHNCTGKTTDKVITISLTQLAYSKDPNVGVNCVLTVTKLDLTSSAATSRLRSEHWRGGQGQHGNISFLLQNR